jgi:molybdopterin synthase sulfur carrier subunit
MDGVRILYFAWLRERAGRAEEIVNPPPDVHTVGALMQWLGTQHNSLAEAFATPRLVRAAVNQNFAGPTTTLANGDEVAFFPPVTGG